MDWRHPLVARVTDEECGAKSSRESDGCREAENNQCLVPTCIRKIEVKCLKNKDKSVYPPKGATIKETSKWTLMAKMANVGKRMDSFQLCSISLQNQNARYIVRSSCTPRVQHDSG